MVQYSIKSNALLVAFMSAKIHCKINTECGDRKVEALILKADENLAIAMYSFGRFSVTHIESGMCFFKGFERAVIAENHLIQLILALRALDIESSLDSDSLIADIKQSTKALDILDGKSLIVWVSEVRAKLLYGCENPFELGDSSSPWCINDELLSKL